MNNKKEAAKAKDVARYILYSAVIGKKIHENYNLANWGYYIIHDFLKRKIDKFYTTTQEGRNKRFYYEYDEKITSSLRSLDIDFTLGNDAPRGGSLGSFVKISKKGKARIYAIRKQLKNREIHENLKNNVQSLSRFL